MAVVIVVWSSCLFRDLHYRDSAFRVLGMDGRGTGDLVLTAGISLRRGLRQECTASPALFNLFIDDVFEVVDHLGCEIPCTFYSAKDPMVGPLRILYTDCCMRIATMP